MLVHQTRPRTLQLSINTPQYLSIRAEEARSLRVLDSLIIHGLSSRFVATSSGLVYTLLHCAIVYPHFTFGDISNPLGSTWSEWCRQIYAILTRPKVHLTFPACADARNRMVCCMLPEYVGWKPLSAQFGSSLAPIPHSIRRLPKPTPYFPV